MSITGNGLKTQEALIGKIGEPMTISARLSEFDELLKAENKVYSVKG